MARYKGAVCRLCRREGTKLFLKGSRCVTEKCAMNRRAYSPGQHGKMRTKLSDYALQLREKQKAKRAYGISEHQFRLYFSRAEKKKGVTGEALLQFLERRLDNVILRLGFATSRAQARQIVRHKFIEINSRQVNVPSYLVKNNDEIAVKGTLHKRKLIQENIKATKDIPVPEWLHVEREKLRGKIVRLPQRNDIQFPIREQLIVELYSK